MKNSIAAGWLAMLVLISGCQEEAVPANAKEDVRAGNDIKAENIILERHGELENEERFTEFLKNLAKRKTDQIRIAAFTTEGDPIFQDLSFDGNNIKLIADSTNDKYGSGKISEMVCTSIEEAESAERIDYVLKGCGGIDGDNVVLTKWK